MKMDISERRQIENEMIFRRANEKIGASLDELDIMHEEDGNPELEWDDKIVLDFKCECSDEDCNARVGIRLSAYQKIHLNRDSFVIKHNHQVDTIEKIIATEPNYCVVVKNKSTSDPGELLNDTTINNA